MARSSSCAKARPACSSFPVRSARARPRSTGSSGPNTCAAWGSMPKAPPDLLARPAGNAAALIGLTLLEGARAALGRLADPDDTEALHDFRVALRRLRSTLRGFRPELGDAVPKKLQRRLRDLARTTGAGRDAEVQLAWIRDHAGAPRWRGGGRVARRLGLAAGPATRSPRPCLRRHPRGSAAAVPPARAARAARP